MGLLFLWGGNDDDIIRHEDMRCVCVSHGACVQCKSQVLCTSHEGHVTHMIVVQLYHITVLHFLNGTEIDIPTTQSNQTNWIRR